MNENNNDNNGCDGCHIGTTDDCIFLSTPYEGKVEFSKCPCRICIVKMMCVKKCEARYEFYIYTSIALNYLEVPFINRDKRK